jgi:hypothetical protein
MKVYEVLTESNAQDLTEAPMGMFNKLGQKIVSKVPGQIGARATGALQAGGEANKVRSELSQYMGRAGIARNALTPQQLATFLTQKGYGSDLKNIMKAVRDPSVPKNTPLSNKEIDQAVLKATQGAAGAATTVGRGQFAPKPTKVPGTFKTSRKKALPPSITNAVAALTPQQKAALIAMLGGGAGTPPTGTP